jgi:hypothetical protein
MPIICAHRHAWEEGEPGGGSLENERQSIQDMAVVLPLALHERQSIQEMAVVLPLALHKTLTCLYERFPRVAGCMCVEG